MKFAYKELKERVPEPEEEMSGMEALNYFKAKTTYREKTNWYHQVVTDILYRMNRVPHNCKALDIGCGSGNLLYELQQTCPDIDVEGIDASKTLLAAASATSTLNFKYCHAQNLKYPSNYFDLVICQDTFHHFVDPVQCLKEMSRVIKNDGVIYITDLRRDAPIELIENAIKNISKNSISHTIFYLRSLKASYTSLDMSDILRKSNILDYEMINGSASPPVSSLISKICDINERSRKDRLFKERWTVVIGNPKK